MAYDIVWEPDGVLVQFSAQLTGRELISATRQVHADERFDSARYVINDFSAIGDNLLTEDALLELSALHYGAYASQPNSRIVFVTTDAALGEELKRLLAASEMASYEIAVMPSVTAARDWLDSQPNLHVMSNVMGFRFH